jgi:hypothetical protein
MEEDDRPEGAPGEVRSPVLYLWAGPDSVHCIATPPPFEEGSLCPFCGWHAQASDWSGCEHLVFVVDDFDDFPQDLAAVWAGSLARAGDNCFDDLADAIWGFMRSCGANRKRLDSLTTERLRLLATALVEEPAFCDESEDVEGPNELVQLPTDAFQSYLRCLFRLVEKEGRTTSYDTGDRWGTSVYLFWAPNAKETAQRAARQVSEDARTLRLGTK